MNNEDVVQDLQISFQDRQIATLKKEWDKIRWNSAVNFSMGFHAILGQYGHHRRRYHDLRHLTECFEHQQEINDVERPDVVRLALFFHDYVYETTPKKPGALSNEDISAATLSLYVTSHLKAESIGDSYEACKIITYTNNHVLPRGLSYESEAALVLDCDVSILGREEVRYDQYEMDIRSEYRDVPDEVFRTARQAIMSSFLDRPRIYHTRSMYERYEAQARSNIERWWL